jgi:ABC-2 type transport system ATP-binding protein
MCCGAPTIEYLTTTVRVPVESAVGTITDAVRRIDQAGIDLVDIAVHRPTLDDVFLSITGEHVPQELPDDGAGQTRTRSMP